MHVYGSIASPFVQRVLLAARAKGVELDLQTPPGGGMRSPEFQAISPMGRVPLLETDSGERICESAAIVGWLDDTLDGPSLMPDDPLARARVREIESVLCGEVASGLRSVLVHRLFMPGGPDAVIDAGIAQASQGLRALDRLLPEDGRYAVGDRLGAADCALAPILHLAVIIAVPTATVGLLDQAPRVVRYLAGIAGDASVARAFAEMDQGFAAIIERNRAAAAETKA